MSDAHPADQVETLIRSVPFFRGLGRVDIARLLGVLEQVHLPTGATVFQENTDADGLYLLEEGEVAVTIRTEDGERSVARLRGPAYFGELGLLLTRRTATISTVSDARLWRLPRHRFEQLARERPGIGLQIASVLAELFDQRQRTSIGAPVREYLTPAPVRSTKRSPLWRAVGGILAVGIPASLWWIAPPAGLTAAAWRVLLVLLGAAAAWLFEPLPDFVVGFLVVAVWGVAGLAPLADTFSGFANPSWAVALGALAVAGAMAQSGLLFRIALWLLRVFPATHRGQVLGLLASGVLITPLVPLSLARIAAVAPLGWEVGQAMGYGPRSRGAAALAFAGLTGYGYFSSVFLTGLVSNFFVLGLFPEPDRAAFSWIAWLRAAAPSGVLMLAGAILSLLALFPPEKASRITADVLRRQQRVLGALTRAEWVTALAVLLFMAGLIVEPLVGLRTEWLAIAALVMVVGGGGLDRERFRSAIDWGLLVLFGLFFGMAAVFHRHGIDAWIARSLVGLAGSVGDPARAVLLLAAAIVVVRLIVPRVPAQLLLALAIVPAAPRLGISPWVAGYVVLMVAYTWIVPAQGLEYLITRDLTRGEAFTDRQGTLLGAALTAVRLLAIAASIPFWRAIGLLGSGAR